MGIIRRQGAKNSIVLYLGVVIGAISTLFIYPLNKDLYGFAQFLIGTSLLLYPLCNLGLNVLLLRFFPRFSNYGDKGHTFFRWTIYISIIVFLIAAGILLFLKEPILIFLEGQGFSEAYILKDYYNQLLILVLLTTLVVLIRAQAINYKRIVVPALLSEFSLKLFLPAVVLISLFTDFGFQEMSIGLILFNVVVVLAMLAYLYRIGAVSTAKAENLTMREVFFNKASTTYSLFSSLSRMGSLLAFRIDAFMITLILGAASNGLYYVILFIANVIQIPFKSINQIAVPMISQAWEDNDLPRISNLYQRSARTLTLASLAIFLFLWWSLPDILLLSPKSAELQEGVNLFIFLGLAKVTNSITSVNEPIINHSKEYRYGLYFVLFLGVSNVFLNYFLISDFGLLGAAMATCFAYIGYNLVKLLFIYFKFGLHPWSPQLTKMFLLALLCILIQLGIGNIPIPFLRVVLNGFLMAFGFVLPSILLKLSPEFNGLLHVVFGKLPIFGKPLQNWIKKYI